jgi:hypothetical protein
VKILASRTGADPLTAWIDHELNGYPEDADLPPYRGPHPVHVLGHFMGPFGSQMTNVQIPSSSWDKKLEADHLFQIELRESVAEVGSMAAEDNVTLGWNANVISKYNQGLQNGLVQPVVTGDMLLAGAKIPVPRHLLVGVLEAVRNRILDLALQLEKVVPNAGQANAPDAEQGLAAMVINNHFHAPSNVAIGSTDVKQSIKPPAKGDVEGLVHFLQKMGLTPELITEFRAAANADEEDPGDGPGRWARVRAWVAKVATDAGTEAIGGAVVAGAIGFLGG